jgi:hypothetical protein
MAHQTPRTTVINVALKPRTCKLVRGTEIPCVSVWGRNQTVGTLGQRIIWRRAARRMHDDTAPGDSRTN